MNKDADGVTCKEYQDGCYVYKILRTLGCSGGVYIEVAVLDDGVVVDKANEITAGLQPGDEASVSLAPPGGIPSGAKARMSKLNCLGY